MTGTMTLTNTWLNRRRAVDSGEPAARVGFEAEAEALEPGHQQVEERRRDQEGARGEARGSQSRSRELPRCRGSTSHYQSEPPETVRSCMVSPAASSRHRKQARAPISAGWISRFWGFAARASAM